MLIARVLTALGLLAVLVPVVVIGPPWLWAAVSLALLAAAYGEWCALLQEPRPGPANWVVLLAAGGAIIALAPEGQIARPFLFAACFPALLFWLFEATRRLRSHRAGGGGRLVALWLLAACWIALLELRGDGPEVLVSAMAIVWVADITAYFAGRAFGRRKLAPSISPGKSWEGAVAGVIAVALLGLVCADIDLLARALPARLVSVWGSFAAALALAALAALSIVGDLFESLLKREAGVKDSGRLLPGHGGILDRIDALVPTMPAVALLHELLR